MLLFIGSEIMFFAGLFAAYFNTRAAAGAAGQAWPPSGLEHVIEPRLVAGHRHDRAGAQLVHDAVRAAAHPARATGRA